MKRIGKIVLCMLIAISLVYTPVMIPQLANTQAVAVAEAATIKLNKKQTTVAVGDTVALKMSGTKKAVKWSTSKKSVATVTKKGVVKGKKAGRAVIKAKVGGKTYKCTVTVKKMPYISAKAKTVYLKGKTTLKMKATKKKVTWSTSKKSVATVSKKGVVTAKKAGTATITAKVGGKSYKCKVTVKKRIKPAKTAITVPKLGDTVKVKITNNGGGKVTAVSTNKSILTVKWNKKWSGTQNTLLITGIRTGVADVKLTNSVSKEVHKIRVTVKKGTVVDQIPDTEQKPESKPDTPAATVYTISYELNGGTNAAENPASYTAGTATSLANPTRDNYDFKGWYSDKSCKTPFDGISEATTGNLTLYAKWHQTALNINGQGMDDMIWSWWYYPQVVTDGDHTFWGYATKDGYCGVADYNKTTGVTNKTTLKKANADDHNGLALTLLKDKRIMAIYAGGHDMNKEVHVRISKNPLDISQFTQHVVLESSSVVSYSQIVESQGTYYLFYRVGNRNWAYRYSKDGINWSDENVFVKANTQYYCKVMPTTQDGLLRILMYSNPAGTDMNIRMGFLNTATNTLYNADGSTKMQDTANGHTSFTIIQPVPTDGKVVRLFDATITAPDKPRFLYAVFNKATKTNESTYYLYDDGQSYEICQGGKPIWDPKYQLGASFVTPDTIVAGRNVVATDYIDLYKFDGTAVTKIKNLDAQSCTSRVRNARPIADVNGKAILWHNGYYNLNSYQDYDTDARLYLLDSDKLIKGADSGLNGADLAQVKAGNVAAAKAFADKMYTNSIADSYLQAPLPWEPIKRNTNWIYYTGLVHKGFLMLDADKYSGEIRDFYSEHIREDGSIVHYNTGELDAAMPSTNILELLDRDDLTETERAQYQKAVQYTYQQLEKQTIYSDAGMLWLHSQNPDGTIKDAWGKWNICLDGVYMSQTFMMKLADSIDAGKVTVMQKDDTELTSSEIWSDVYKRMIFVMQKMKSSKTGLLNHGYAVETKEVNNAFWSRGIGWYAMALVEAAENHPNQEKREILTKYYNQLMTAVCEWQDPETFLWYNVTNGDESISLNKGSEVIANKPESSGSAMFAYCLLRGYHSGLLKDAEFRTAGLRAYNALMETKMTGEGLIDTIASCNVVVNQANYMASGYAVNDGKGIGPLMMATKYAY